MAMFTCCRRRRKQGLLAGVLVQQRKRESRPSLPSIVLANVQSLDNKLDELWSRLVFQRDIKFFNVMVFTETWLNPSISDSTIVTEGVSIHHRNNKFWEEQGRKCLLHGEQSVVLRCGDYFFGLFSGPGAPHDQMQTLLYPKGVYIGRYNSSLYSATFRHKLGPGRASCSHRQNRDLTAGGCIYCGRGF